MLKMVLLFIMLCLNGLALATPASPITIQQITTTLEPAKVPAKNFSLTINLTANNSLNLWALGFYMPRTFDSMINKTMQISINPELTMEICTTNSKPLCYPLKLVKSPAKFATAGYTTVLAPADPSLKLIGGETYSIKLANNNQGLPGNYSAMPQSFFIILHGDEVIPVTNVLPEHYQFANYHPEQITLAIAKHNIDNWLQAKSIEANNLADQYHLLPTPVSVKSNNTSGFTLVKNTQLTLTDEFNNDASNHDLLASYLKQDLNIKLASQTSHGAINIRKITLPNPEGYQLEISNLAITISASTPAGVFYGLQTLRQLWHQNSILPGLIIEDYPRFKYRGIMLDVARHFFTLPEIKKLIDVMAAQKLNTLHIHFADDEGWRLALTNDPSDTLQKLTDVGGVRGFFPGSKLPPVLLGQANIDMTNRENFSAGSQIIQPDYPTANQPYAGYYSTTDIKTLITYANTHQITIIPEIDLPGHARALIKALPTIFKDANDKTIFNSVQFYNDNVIPVCLYQQQNSQGKVFTATINKIIQRINQLFADQNTVYHTNEVSLGGDEVSKLAWSDDSSCTGVWSTLSALAKTQYFFSALPTTQGLLSGWQQLVQDDAGTLGKSVLPAATVGHLWAWEITGNNAKQKGIQDAVNLINAGYATVLAFADDTYFDLTYTSELYEPGFRWANSFADTHAALRIAYDAVQTEHMANPQQLDHLLGVEGALWSENLYNLTHLVYMALPKMTGLAEAAWASADTTTDADGKLNWQSLVYRLGTDTNGFLAYLYQISQLKYRGYPHGIAAEIPADGEKL
jgi:hexosaminidase